MSNISDDALLSDMSIPGTHDSAAYNSIWPFVTTQTMDIPHQLESGIRYFDLRCGLVNDVLEMCHGRALLGLRLDAVLDAMYAFLAAHESECLIVQIKQDRADDKSPDVTFAQAVSAAIDTDTSTRERWRTLSTTPTLGDVRGRIQLFRRYKGPPYRGIDVSRWQDNPSTPFAIHTRAGVKVVVQDHYNPEHPMALPDFIDRKGGDVSGLLQAAAADPHAETWYINFASAFQFNFFYQYQPKQIAMGAYHDFKWVVGINPRLCSYLAARSNDDEQKRKRYGIVVLDYLEQPSEELVKGVIRSNILGRKQKSKRWTAVLWQPITLVIVFLLLLYLGGSILVLVYRPTTRRPWCPSWAHACALET